MRSQSSRVASRRFVNATVDLLLQPVLRAVYGRDGASGERRPLPTRQQTSTRTVTNAAGTTDPSTTLPLGHRSHRVAADVVRIAACRAAITRSDTTRLVLLPSGQRSSADSVTARSTVATSVP